MIARAASPRPSGDRRARRVGDAAPDLRHRQRLADHARRRDEHLGAARADRARRRVGHRGRVAATARAHRDVRAAAVHDHAAHATRAHALARQLDGRADDRRAREDARRRDGRVGGDQREVEPARLDAAAHTAARKPGTVSSAFEIHLGFARAQTRPWHFLYFLPLPHGHGSLRPTFAIGPVAAPIVRGAGRAAGGLASGGGEERSGAGTGTARGASGGGGRANLNTSSSACASMRAFISCTDRNPSRWYSSFRVLCPYARMLMPARRLSIECR
jgi:hypothetical protein